MNNEILDDFQKRSGTHERFKFYGIHFLTVFGLIWGAALLHARGLIDLLPVLVSWSALLGLFLLFLATLFFWRIYLGFIWKYSIIIATATFIIACFILGLVIDELGLSPMTLSFDGEIMRLFVFSLGYVILSLLPAEIAYRLNIR